QRARHRAAHAERVPVVDDLDAVGRCGHAEQAHAVVARHDAGDVVERRRPGQGGEDLPPGDLPPALDGHGGGGDAGGRSGGDALGERLAVDVALVDDTAVHPFADLGVAG